MRIGSAVPVIVTVLLAACSPQGPAQPPPASSSAPASQATPSGSAAAAPAADKGTAPAASAAAATATPASAPPASATEAPAASAAPAAAARAPEPPKFHEVTIPSGTVLSVKLNTPIASDTSKVEDAVRGSLTKPLVVSGTTAVPAGAEIVGSVIDAKPSGRVKGRASIAFRFSRLIVGSETHQIHTAQIARQAAADTKGDVTKGAIGGGVGAVVGGVIGGGKGAAIGAAAGGTGAVLATKGKEVRLPAGAVVSTHLEQPLAVLVPVTAK
jgi:hypothetical protein